MTTCLALDAVTQTGPLERDDARLRPLEPQERDEFERLAMAHLDAAYSGALRLAGNPTDAEDLVQDTFFRAMRAFRRFLPGTNFKAWLFRIMMNLYINEYRRRARRPRRAEDVDPSDLGWAGVTSDPEACALQQIEADYLHNAIARLPDKFRMVIMLADEQGLSYEEIARIMRSPVGTVRSRLHRSRRMLAHRLRGYAREAGHLSPAGITT